MGGLFGGDDVEEEFSRVYTGYFKGMVRCYNEKDYKETKDKINEVFKELVKLVS